MNSRTCSHGRFPRFPFSTQPPRGIDAPLDVAGVPRVHHDGAGFGGDAVHQERLRPLGESRAGARGGLPGALLAETRRRGAEEAAGDTGVAAGRDAVPRCSL